MRNRFDEQLFELNREIIEMGAMCEEAIASGLYETLQFPLNYLSTEKELRILQLCEEADMGFIAMKGMSGGLIQNGRAAYAYLNQFPSVLPIWGVQKEEELDEFLGCAVNVPTMEDEEVKAVIEERGGKVTGSVTSKTNYLINNDTTSNSSKNKKAKELNIPILSEEDFLEMLK